MGSSYEFLSLDQVLDLHSTSIDLFSPGESKRVREPGLLESAVYNPQQTFEGEYLYQSISEMAAAYLFGLCQNHAFDNGNKRIAFFACEAFLQMNGYELRVTEQEGVELTLQVTNHQLDREALTQELEQYIDLATRD